MSLSKKCSFNPDWTNPETSAHATWIRPVPNDPNSARCTMCCKKFSLSNMGKRAITSDVESKKHQAAMKSLQSVSQTRVVSFLETATNAGSPSAVPAGISSGGCNSGRSAAAMLPTTATEALSPSLMTSVRSFQLKNEVTKAEIMWCLNTIMTHGSFRSAAASASLFPLMFPTCEIATKMQLGKDKVGYTICHGIGPYFQEKLLSSLSSVPYLVIAFDESLNKVTQKEQMDVLIRYWDQTDATVKTRYLTSCFLGHTCAEDLSVAFRKATEGIKQMKILQVSMDGPNVNLKFLRSLKEELREADNSHKILDIGSCGLHIVNGAFKTGHSATHWDLVAFLRGSYNLFKCAPARRADYTRYTGSVVFPLKFCPVRWLENRKVISRALDIIPNLLKYVECSKEAKKPPACASFSTVEKAVGDRMLPVKLAFMLSIAEELEPFLAEFQTDKPMLPFVAPALDRLLRSLLGRIIRKEFLQATNTSSKLLRIDLENPDNMVSAAAFDIGFAAKNEFRKIPKPSQLTVLSFKKDCISFVKRCSQKVMERSPLQYKLTRGASCLDPASALSPEAGAKKLCMALEVLTEHQWMTGLEAERTHRSYVEVCSLSSVQVALRSFDRKEQRLDALWFELCSRDHKELFLFVKLILCMSHGNAAVERGFSVNKECLVENLKEESLIAQRVVYDAVSAVGGVAKIDVTNTMMQMVRGANARWKEELQRKRQERLDASDAERKKKRVAALVKELQHKKQKLISDAQLQASRLEEEIISLKHA
ncbi:uncharacterized protein LOC144121784 [Amblyomma americanum]